MLLLPCVFTLGGGVSLEGGRTAQRFRAAAAKQKACWGGGGCALFCSICSMLLHSCRTAPAAAAAAAADQRPRRPAGKRWRAVAILTPRTPLHTPLHCAAIHSTHHHRHRHRLPTCTAPPARPPSSCRAPSPWPCGSRPVLVLVLLLVILDGVF